MKRTYKVRRDFEHFRDVVNKYAFHFHELKYRDNAVNKETWDEFWREVLQRSETSQIFYKDIYQYHGFKFKTILGDYIIVDCTTFDRKIISVR